MSAAYGCGVMAAEHALRCAWVGFGGSAGDESITRLLSRHAEPHRRYHTATHVMRVLEQVEEILTAENTPGIDANAIRAAALFHDVVYDPRSTTNERESAAFAVAALWKLRWPESQLALVHHLIEATKGHNAAGMEAAVLFDADLAILGAEPAAYAEYVDGVRFEYAFVDDDAWRTGRAAVLHSFLERSHIFSTPTMAAAREAQARINLAAELNALTADR